ncbi:MAG: lysophospholipid acyltransferase family protein [Deltaproteobacteria bacterium]|nr:lysophospholipid acyltransferase family protein [Deltaproteobacteria bacterium]
MKFPEVREIMIPCTASFIIKLVGWTLRMTTVGEEHFEQFRSEGKPVLFAFWHNRLLYTCYFLRKKNLTMMISKSRDGERIARVARHFGIDSIRGSSSRDGLRAIGKMVRVLRNGGNGGITPDGPRGPKYQVQAGVLLAAKKSGVPILPVSINFDRKKIFASWDRFRFPYPFARTILVFGPPFFVPPDAQGETLERLKRELEHALMSVTEKADRYFL